VAKKEKRRNCKKVTKVLNDNRIPMKELFVDQLVESTANDTAPLKI